MHAQTMEGLVGARINMELMNTPMRIYREARQRGDTAVMERAMGYAGDFAGQAQAYQKKAEEGMKKDAREEKERLKRMQEEAAQKRRKEKESGFSPDSVQDSGEAAGETAQTEAAETEETAGGSAGTEAAGIKGTEIEAAGSKEAGTKETGIKAGAASVRVDVYV